MPVPAFPKYRVSPPRKKRHLPDRNCLPQCSRNFGREYQCLKMWTGSSRMKILEAANDHDITEPFRPEQMVSKWARPPLIYVQIRQNSTHSNQKRRGKLKNPYRLLLSKFHILAKTDRFSGSSLHNHILETRNQRIISAIVTLYLILVCLILYVTID